MGLPGKSAFFNREFLEHLDDFIDIGKLAHFVNLGKGDFSVFIHDNVAPLSKAVLLPEYAKKFGDSTVRPRNQPVTGFP